MAERWRNNARQMDVHRSWWWILIQCSWFVNQEVTASMLATVAAFVQTTNDWRGSVCLLSNVQARCGPIIRVEPLSARWFSGMHQLAALSQCLFLLRATFPRRWVAMFSCCQDSPIRSAQEAPQDESHAVGLHGIWTKHRWHSYKIYRQA